MYSSVINDSRIGIFGSERKRKGKLALDMFVILHVTENKRNICCDRKDVIKICIISPRKKASYF